MTVKELKAKLVAVPDNALVVCPAPDHQYRAPYHAAAATALFEDDFISEDPEPDGPIGEATYFGERRAVFLVS